MKLWVLLLMGLLLFAFFVIVRRWHDFSMLFTIAIGFAVNANIYNGITMPVYLGNIKFSIDSILYTGFTFTVIICAYEYGVRKAKILTSSTVAAVLLSAAIEFLAHLSSNGYSDAILINLFGYFSSSVGTVVGVWIALALYEKIKDRMNLYLLVTILVLVISIFNSAFYHAYYLFATGNVDGFGYIVLGSYLGKFYSIILGLIGFYINRHFWIPMGLMDKYQKNKKDDIEGQDDGTNK